MHQDQSMESHLPQINAGPAIVVGCVGVEWYEGHCVNDISPLVSGISNYHYPSTSKPHVLPLGQATLWAFKLAINALEHKWIYTHAACCCPTHSFSISTLRYPCLVLWSLFSTLHFPFPIFHFPCCMQIQAAFLPLYHIHLSESLKKKKERNIINKNVRHHHLPSACCSGVLFKRI